MKLENKIKRTLIVLAVIFMGISLFGCKDNTDEPPVVNPNVKEVLNGFEVVTENPVIEEKVEFFCIFLN